MGQAPSQNSFVEAKHRVVLAVYVPAATAYENRTRRRVDHQRHKERCREHNDQRPWHEPHELTHHIGPEEQRRKRHQRCYRGSGHRPGHFLSADQRRLGPTHSLHAVPIDVLDDDDGIVHQHADTHHQAEEHDHVKRRAHKRHQNKRNHHGQGHRQRHEHAIAHTHEQQENHEDEDKAGEEVVLKFPHHLVNVFRLIHHGGELHSGRNPDLVQRLPDTPHKADGIDAASLLHGQRDTGFPVQPGNR